MRDHPFFSAALLSLLASGEQEARRLGHGTLETLHLLLALGTTTTSAAGVALAQLDVDGSVLLASVARAIEESETERRRVADGALSYALPVRRALEHAMSEAYLAGHHPVNSGYLLLGMLHQPDDPGAIALCSAGVTLNGMRRVLRMTSIPSSEM